MLLKFVYDFRDRDSPGSRVKSKLKKFVSFKTESAPERKQETEEDIGISEPTLPPPPDYLTNTDQYEGMSLLGSKTEENGGFKGQDVTPEPYLVPITP